MKLPGFKRITSDDFSAEERSLIDRIAFAINPFASDIVDAFNKKITVTDNLNQVFKDVDVTLNASGVPKQTTSFKVEVTGKLYGISVEKADNLTNPAAYPTAAPFITFSQNGDVITIKHVTGLQADNKWRLKLLCKGN